MHLFFFLHYESSLLKYWQVLRDGKWSEEDAAVLVPGDIITVKLGDIVPADARLLDGDPLKIDQVNIYYQCSIYLVINFTFMSQ